MDFIVEFLNMTGPTTNTGRVDNKEKTIMENSNNVGSSSPTLKKESLELWMSFILICIVKMTLNSLYTKCI